MSVARREKTKKKESVGEIVKTLIYALLIAGVFRTVLYQPFSIPSGSMKSTLLVGDYLFVSKYAYGWSRHSIPWSPNLFDGRIFGREPARGDVIVFKYPPDGRTDYIKRLIGLPGDVIRMQAGVLTINGEPVKRERVDDFLEPMRAGLRCIGQREVGGERFCVKERWRETLPNGVSHDTLNADSNEGYGDNSGPFVVPEASYFFMGDNRDNSQDSRFPAAVGFVPAENLVGRAEVIFLSADGPFWRFWTWRFDRFFKSIE